MEELNLEKITLSELKKICKEKKIKGYSSKSKKELIELLKIKDETNLEQKSPEAKVSNVSPLRYPGGKTRACKILDETISKYFDITQFNTLVSPFFGGGSFEFYFQNKYNVKLCVNDKFVPLYNFWKQVKSDKNALCEELRKINVVTKEKFNDYRNTILNSKDILTQAVQYFIINRCSFSGATLSGGFSEEASLKRYTSSSIDRIEALDFSNIDIYNYDFSEFINKFSNEKTLLFLDPPYYLEKKSKLYGNNGDMHENFDHVALFNILKNKNEVSGTIGSKKHWIMTYNNCDYIKNLYKDFIIIETCWSYGMNNSKESSEIIIISKSFASG
jgi:DNA adenine methylase